MARRPTCLPDCYNGTAEFTSWKEHCNVCCRASGWDGADKANIIGSRLTGKALTWYQTVPVETRDDPDELLAALGKRFGTVSQPERHYAGLQGRRRRKGASLADLADEAGRTSIPHNWRRRTDAASKTGVH